MLFRNRRLVRAVACYLLVQTVTSLAWPIRTLAMSGPDQPEFTTYTGAGTTDLVNLTTGDFSYSIPLLDIPGPERSFSLPLTYKAGIQLEQEASWVGLGWSFNVGAITRTLNGYADDASNDPVTSLFDKELDVIDHAVVIPGLFSQDVSKYNGTSGAVDILGLASVNWDKNGLAGGDLIGVGYQKGDGGNVNPVRLTLAVASIASMGWAAAASTTSSVGLGLAGEAGKSLLMGSASALAMGAFGNARLAGVAGYNNQPTDWKTGTYFESEEHIAYYNGLTENRYGSLYFSKMSQQVSSPTANASSSISPTILKNGISSQSPQFIAQRTCAADVHGNQSMETAADVHQASIGNFSSIMNRELPISIAHDYFNVMGEEATGTIRPQRLDIGSVAYPKLATADCDKHAKYMTVPFLNTYKVGFRYENDLSNTYTYLQNEQDKQNGYDVGFQMTDNKQAITVTDQRLFDETKRIEATRKGLIATNNANQHLVQGRHVTWYSNAEIEQMATSPFSGYANGFLDIAPPVSGDGTLNSFRHQLPPDGIGAFEVTTADGTTYHYSLPVYQYLTYQQADEQQLPTTVGKLGRYTRRDGPNYKYATAWLLTAITSADYIDRNNSGTVDNADWGGWVNFSYGKFSSQFKWRQPYIGTSYSDDKSPIEYESYTEGYKETYYLNTISTRTHTALFVKSAREDGRGHFINNQSSSTQGYEQFPAASLRLDEIIMLDNAAWQKVQTPDGIRTTNDDSAPVPALTIDTALNGSSNDCQCGDDFGQVLDSKDLTVDSRIQQFVEANAIKRVHFNYGYDLCRGTPNSFQYRYGDASSLPLMDMANISTNRGGKLTLKSVSFFGPTVNLLPTKVMPDFRFEYDSSIHSAAETNPQYGKEKWDAFGMYQPTGGHDITSHKPNASAYAAPWSLTRITSPLGGVTEITYERDQYAHASEFGVKDVSLDFQNATPGAQALTLSTRGNPDFIGTLADYLKPTDTIYLTGTLTYTCYEPGRGEEGSEDWVNHALTYTNQPVQVASVKGNTITLVQPVDCQCFDDNPPVSFDAGGFNALLPANKVGGDIRVAAITTSEGDAGAKYQIRYRYTNGITPHSNSTGVLAKEPSFIGKSCDFNLDDIFDYPTTPVLYSQVTVLRGAFRENSDVDFEQRENYAFYTPASGMVMAQEHAASNWLFWNASAQNYSNHTDFAANRITVNTGLIGRPKAVRVYNKQGQQELSTDFLYDDQVHNADGIANQGHYTEGVLNNEMFNDYYVVNRTTKEYVPAVLVGTRSTRNGLSITNNNLLYDFYTGQVLETAFTNSLGKIYHSRTVPAYTQPGNEGMGAKGDNPANQHMLAQLGAAYTFVEVPGGPAYDPLNPLNPTTSHVLSASVQAWQRNWTNYREPDATGTYQDVTGQQAVWRQAATYTWQSPVLNTDGSFKNFTPFNWTGTSDSRWIKTGETVRYDHYSHAVEARDVNGQYAAQKIGYNQTQLVASASNARYTEVAYSGAEDQLPVAGTTHFGGEVVAGSGTAVSSPTHTGFYSLQVPSGQQGFLYRAQAGRDVILGRTYRVSAWANANATSGTLYASLNGKRLAQSTIASPTTKKAGAWYLLSLLVTIPASANGQPIEFGCANEGATAANFDDFRVAPLTSTMTSRVYDPRTSLLLYSLDNDNLFTRYEYMPTGRLKRVYQETLDGTGNSLTAQKLVKEYDYNYALLSYPTWISTLYTCATDGDGNYNGLELRQEIDINPLSSHANSTRWVVNGASTVCTPPMCDLNNADVFPVRMRNNICEKALPDNSNPKGAQETLACYSNGRTGHLIKYHWIWPDNTPVPDTYSDCIVDGPTRTN